MGARDEKHCRAGVGSGCLGAVSPAWIHSHVALSVNHGRGIWGPRQSAVRADFAHSGTVV